MVMFMYISATGVMASDREDILRQYERFDRTPGDMKIADHWALVNWSYRGESEGVDLWHFMDGQWHYLVGGGGAMGPGELHQYGVPKQYWLKLLAYSPTREDINNALSSGPYWAWITSRERMTGEDLNSYSGWELTLMRNEIFARHGRAFNDPELRDYFQSRSWYKVNPAFNNSMLTKIEQYNANYIMEYQKKHKRFE